jgi:hypothetical protein
MRKPFFPRVLLITLLYLSVFVLLVSFQFAKASGTSLKAGSLFVSGQYRIQEEGGEEGEYILDGDIHVLFGGLDFCITRGDKGNSLKVTGADGNEIGLFPERMLISEDSVNFIFPEGTKLVFAALSAAKEKKISAVFSKDAAGI